MRWADVILLEHMPGFPQQYVAWIEGPYHGFTIDIIAMDLDEAVALAHEYVASEPMHIEAEAVAAEHDPAGENDEVYYDVTMTQHMGNAPSETTPVGVIVPVEKS